MEPRACPGSALLRPSLPGSRRTREGRFVRLRVFAGKEDEGEPDQKKLNQTEQRMKEMKQTLERAGYDSALAKAKLEEWRGLGLKTSSEVSKHLVNGAIGALGAKAGWLAFYATVTWLFYQWSLASDEGGFLQLFLTIFTYLNAYSFLQELLLFITLAYATIQFASNPVLLDAVQEIAGVSPEIPALNVKPQKVVDVLQVFSSLQELNTRLKEMKISPSPVDALSSMLTLSQMSTDVEELCSLESDMEACIADLDTAAKIFNRYDQNGDLKLEQEELRLMLSDVGLNLEEDEVEEAFKILESNNQDGYVEFDEFVTFWQNKLQQPESPQGESRGNDGDLLAEELSKLVAENDKNENRT